MGGETCSNSADKLMGNADQVSHQLNNILNEKHRRYRKSLAELRTMEQSSIPSMNTILDENNN
jgi:hypothetical protein